MDLRKENILIVDDEKLLVKGLKNSLIQEGFDVSTAYDGYEALRKVACEKIDLIILDIMLPGIDGMTVCKKIRKTLDIPIIMLTAKDDHIDKILGLEIGADDYITKPFHTRELIARINAVIRRLRKMKKEEEKVEFYNFDVKGSEITLTAKEFDIIKILATNPGVVFSREKIFEIVWDEISYDTRTVDVHISKLRDKIEEDPSNPKIIKTKWGVGYYLKKDRL